MNGHQLESLGLTPARVESTVDFLLKYANTCQQEKDARPVTIDVSTAFVVNVGPTVQFGLSGERWNLHLEVASARCEAGQWMMLINPAAALDLWRGAGLLYREANFGFGYYLSVITGDLEPSSIDLLHAGVAMLAERARRLAREPAEVAGSAPLPEELQHPQQQAYWLLAAATFAARYNDERIKEPVEDLLRSSPNRYSAAPVGALGIPTATLWQAAGWLMQPAATGAPRLAELLGDLARRYEDSIRSAMQNRYLWENGAAAVDVGSVDIAALTLSGYLAFGDALQEGMRTLRENMGDLAGAQLDASLHLAHPEELWPA